MEQINGIVKNWKLERPNLVLSITGGSKNYNLNKELEMEIEKAFSKIASFNTNTWFVTAGTNMGVMELVGRSVSPYTYHKKNILLGISPWDVLAFKCEMVRVISI